MMSFVPCVSLQLQRRHEQMKKNLEAQHKELEEKRRVFEEERANWETQQRLEQQKQEASRYDLHTSGCSLSGVKMVHSDGLVPPCG